MTRAGDFVGLIDWHGKVGGAEGIRTPDPHNAVVAFFRRPFPS
jgi:hypothetical protein